MNSNIDYKSEKEEEEGEMASSYAIYSKNGLNHQLKNGFFNQHLLTSVATLITLSRLFTRLKLSGIVNENRRVLYTWQILCYIRLDGLEWIYTVEQKTVSHIQTNTLITS